MTTRCTEKAIPLETLCRVDLEKVREDQEVAINEGELGLALTTHFYALSVNPFYGGGIFESRSNKTSDYWPNGATADNLWEGPKEYLASKEEVECSSSEDEKLESQSLAKGEINTPRLCEETILVHAQGRSVDVAATARFLLCMKEHGKILFYPPIETVPLFRQFFDEDSGIEVIEAVKKGSFDKHISLFSLPLLFIDELPQLPFLERSGSEQFDCSFLGADRVKIGLIGSGFPPSWMERAGAVFYQLSTGSGNRIFPKATDFTSRLKNNLPTLLGAMAECDELYVDGSLYGRVAGAMMGLKARVVASKELPDSLSPAYEQNASLYPNVKRVSPGVEQKKLSRSV